MTRTPTFPRGGIQVPSCKAETREAPISNASVPPVATVPLRQHVGPPAICLVKAGDLVREGQPIGRAADRLSAAVHAPIPGRVLEVREIAAADGTRSPAVVIELGGAFEQSGRPPAASDWPSMGPAELLSLIREAGVVELGGDPVPLAPSWQAARERSPERLVANAIEGEPYLAAEHRLLLERPGEVAEGVRIAQRVLGCRRVTFALPEDAAEAARGALAILQGEGVEADLALFQDRWPQGEETQLAAALGGTAPPDGGALDSGMAMTSIATLVAVRNAVALGRPLVDRVITVAGPGVRAPRNLKARVGTRVGDLIEEAGGLRRPGPIVLGGPMRGVAARNLDVPISRTTAAVLVLDRREEPRGRPWPCIRCGRCLEACPWGLEPVLLSKAVAAGRGDRASALGLDRCRECGCCSYVCPSRIPIASLLRAARR